MAVDALDPGPNGTYPNLPRNPDGTIDTARMPLGWDLQDGVLIDLVPGNLRDSAGALLPIPGLAEAEAAEKKRTEHLRMRAGQTTRRTH